MNPLKMNPVEKRLLMGGILNGLIYYGNLYAENTLADYPAELKQKLDPHVPTYGEMLADVAPPLALYGIQKVSKSAGTKEKLGDYAFGASLYAFPTLMVRTGVDTLYVEGTNARPTAAARGAMIASKYVVRPTRMTPVASASVSKYVVTS
jgi:hypothetical protein